MLCFLLSVIFLSMVVDFGFPGLMFEFVCIEGKTFEEVMGGGVFPSRITKFSRGRRFFFSLNLEKFRWLAVELVFLLFQR